MEQHAALRLSTAQARHREALDKVTASLRRAEAQQVSLVKEATESLIKESMASERSQFAQIEQARQESTQVRSQMESLRSQLESRVHEAEARRGPSRELGAPRRPEPAGVRAAR